jgi:hypothetical protein
MWMALRGMELYPNPPGLRERGAGWDSSDVACAAILSCLMIIIWFDCFRYIVSQYGSRVKQGPQAGEVQVPRANEHFGLQGSEVLLKILHTDYFAELSSHRRRCGHSQDAALPWYSDSGLQAQIRLLAASTRILRWKRTTDFVVAKVRHEGVGYVGGGEWGNEGVRDWESEGGWSTPLAYSTSGDLECRLELVKYEQLPWAGDLNTSQQAGIFLLQFDLCPPEGVVQIRP